VTRHQQKQDFVDELIKEIHTKKNTRFTNEPVRTIYFGGGTPSLLSPQQVESILKAIHSVFNQELEEITLEINPDDVSRDYLAGLKSAGINRASMGVQSFNPDLLKFMNRAHTSEEALQCMEMLRDSAFMVFTVDLIYGNPGQSLDILQQDIETILQFNPPHVSAYSLTIEPQTRLGKQVKLGRLIPPQDDTVSDHFDLVVDKLGEAGIQQYEVSNYARPGSEAVHNSNYWSHENYLGLGPGAHSFWWNKDRNPAQRWNNESNLNNYLAGGWKNPHELEELNLSDLAEERLMLGLRTKKGVNKKALESNYNFILNDRQQSYLETLHKKGLAEIGPQIQLTKGGLKIADSILLDLITM